MRAPRCGFVWLLSCLPILLALLEGIAWGQDANLYHWQSVLGAWQRNRESFGSQLTTFVALVV